MAEENTKKIRLAILASGSGTNAENIIRYFSGHAKVEVVLVVSSRSGAYVMQRAAALNVPCRCVPAAKWEDDAAIKQLFREYRVDFVVLAGYLLKLPEYFIQLFPGRIINIHPALLPKFGGKGMYGNHVHQAVLQAGETKSGITIHLVNENYDEGRILFQASLEIKPGETPESLASRIHELEHQHYPRVLENYILQ